VSATTGIEWTDATWNPVTGCDEVSPGCDRCYAKTFAERFRGTEGHYFEQGFDVVLRPDKLTLPLTWRKPKKVFVNSMSDLFHKDVPDEYIARVFAVMAATPQHIYQVLTKRHGRMRSLLRSDAFRVLTKDMHSEMQLAKLLPYKPLVINTWPLPNVWLGVSVEDQHWANLRIPALIDTPAAVRFLSCEPLLGPVDLTAVYQQPAHMRLWAVDSTRETKPVDWVIVGGESGHGARPMHPDWARKLRDQCTEAGVAFHFKQWGEWGPAPWRVERAAGESVEDYKRRAEAEGATHAYAVWAHEYEHEPHAPSHKPWSAERTSLGDEHAPIRRWGKKVSGRKLDDRTWDQFPGAFGQEEVA
jgi:protein gp37